MSGAASDLQAAGTDVVHRCGAVPASAGTSQPSAADSWLQSSIQHCSCLKLAADNTAPAVLHTLQLCCPEMPELVQWDVRCRSHKAAALLQHWTDITTTTHRFDDLAGRFERPDSCNRWDSPLFVVRPGAWLQAQAPKTCASTHARLQWMQ